MGMLCKVVDQPVEDFVWYVGLCQLLWQGGVLNFVNSFAEVQSINQSVYFRVAYVTLLPQSHYIKCNREEI